MLVTGQPLRVTVVIPFFNAGRFLEEAVSSVLAQTYVSWELLLVDDGSSDRSTELARQYASGMPAKVRYLEHPGHQNRGSSAARNVGIRQAAGDWVAFLDSDDVWASEKLEQQVGILATHPEVDLLYGSPLVWHSWSNSHPRPGRDYVPNMGMPLHEVLPGSFLLARMLRREAHCPPMSNVIVRRAAALSAGLFEEQFRGLHDDQAFFAKVCLHARVLVSDHCWHKYRQHADSCLARATAGGQRRLARKRYLKWFRRYLREQREGDSEICKIVEEQLRPYRFTRRLRSRMRHEVRRVLPAPLRSWLRRCRRVIGLSPTRV